MNALAVFFVFLAGAFVHAELTFVAAGIAIANSEAGWVPAVVGCFLGTMAGDFFWFSIGRIFGRWALERPPLGWFMSAGRLQVAEKWFARWGNWLIIFSPFLPGLSTYIQCSAGMMKMSFSRCMFLFAMAAAIHAPLVIYLAYSIGETLYEHFPRYRHYGVLSLLAVLIVFLAWHVSMSALRRKVEATDRS